MFQIRKAKVTDVPQIYDLLKDFAAKGLMLPRSLSELYDVIRSVYVACPENDAASVAGVCALHVCWSDLGEIRSMSVKQQYQGKDLGAELLAACERDALELDLKRLFVLTYIPKYFSRFGFNEIDKSQLPHKIWADCPEMYQFPGLRRSGHGKNPMTMPDNQKEYALHLLETARHISPADAEVYLLAKSSMAVAAKDGRVDQVRRNDELGAALRIIDQGKMGFAFTTDFSPSALKRTAELAVQAAGIADREEHLTLPDPPESPWPKVPGPDSEAGNIQDQERFDRALTLESSAKEFDPRVERVRQAEYREARYSVFLCNTRGLTHGYSGTVFSAGITVKAADGDDAEIGHESDFSKLFKTLDVIKIGREAARRAVEALGGRKAATGIVPVVFENQVVASLFNLLSSAFLADQVSKGKSRLAGRLGQKIMSDHITLVDDGLYPDGLATSPADGEGLPSQRTVLVENGILASYLYNQTQAKKDNTRPTGNSVRSGFKAPPTIGSTNLILSKGTIEMKDLIGGIDQGLLVTDVMGLHTANPITGDFSIGTSGQWIENGRLSHPVKSMALAGNLWEMVEHITGVGADFRLFGSIGAPSVLVDRLTLSGDGA